MAIDFERIEYPKFSDFLILNLLLRFAQLIPPVHFFKLFNKLLFCCLNFFLHWFFILLWYNWFHKIEILILLELFISIFAHCVHFLLKHLLFHCEYFLFLGLWLIHRFRFKRWLKFLLYINIEIHFNSITISIIEETLFYFVYLGFVIRLRSELLLLLLLWGFCCCARLLFLLSTNWRCFYNKCLIMFYKYFLAHLHHRKAYFAYIHLPLLIIISSNISHNYIIQYYY